MPSSGRIGVDLVHVWDRAGTQGAKILTTLAWGDRVEVTTQTATAVTISLPVTRTDGASTVIADLPGFIRKPSAASGLTLADVVVAEDDPVAARVLRADFVDVQQGDGAVVETPQGKVILIDGGDNQMFARFLAARFPGTTAAAPKPVDCIVVTHGDADHFAGLTQIFRSESNASVRKRLFIRPERVFHNGIVKRASTKTVAGKKKDVPDSELLGATGKTGGKTFVVDLFDDPRKAERPNQPFREWGAALDAWEARGPAPIQLRRLHRAGAAGAFDFLAPEGITVDVLGPTEKKVGARRGLAFLGRPRPRLSRREGAAKATGLSASHTINGQSVLLRLTYGNVRFLFAGDLNEESEDALVAEHAAGTADLQAEVLKVPHHGSAEYAAGFFEAVAPVVSVVSSGDENERQEYVHPRATLMGALGRHARPSVAEPVIFVTELVAFFRVENLVKPVDPKVAKRRKTTLGSDAFFGFSRAAFGTVKVRTDGTRLLVYTYSGKDDLQEAYAFEVTAGNVKGIPVRTP